VFPQVFPFHLIKQVIFRIFCKNNWSAEYQVDRWDKKFSECKKFTKQQMRNMNDNYVQENGEHIKMENPTKN
jgi:hypothetical protein